MVTMKSKTIFCLVKMLLTSLIFFVITGCATLGLNGDSEEIMEIIEKPAPIGVAKVDNLVDSAFELYYSMIDVTTELNDFQYYLTGLINDPIPFLKETANMKLKQAANVVKDRYQPIELGAALLN